MTKKHHRKTITIIVIAIIIVLLIGFLIWGFISNWKFFGKKDKKISMEKYTPKSKKLTKLYSQLVKSYNNLTYTDPDYGFYDGTINLDNTNFNKVSKIIKKMNKILSLDKKHYSFNKKDNQINLSHTFMNTLRNKLLDENPPAKKKKNICANFYWGDDCGEYINKEDIFKLKLKNYNKDYITFSDEYIDLDGGVGPYFRLVHPERDRLGVEWSEKPCRDTGGVESNELHKKFKHILKKPECEFQRGLKQQIKNRPERKIQGYDFHKGMDSNANDIRCIKNINLSEAKEACDIDSRCKGFNMDGFNKHSCLKYQINDNLNSTGISDLYIKKDKKKKRKKRITPVV